MHTRANAAFHNTNGFGSCHAHAQVGHTANNGNGMICEDREGIVECGVVSHVASKRLGGTLGEDIAVFRLMRFLGRIQRPSS